MFNMNLLSTPSSEEGSPQNRSSSMSSVEGKKDRDTFTNLQNEFDGKVFGVSLEESLKVAQEEVIIQKSTNEIGSIPVVIAKSGKYLKENALDTTGIFRIAGSNKRVRELQAVFSKPPDYGRKFEGWCDFNVHDIATLLKRYLNSLSEPLVPLALYDIFRNPILENPKINEHKEQIIKDYEDIYMLLPQQNRHLILYLAALLNLFARNEKKNLMSASNLAAIVQPSLLSHPKDEMCPKEYEASRTVIEFLILHASDIIPNTEKANKDTMPHAGTVAEFNNITVPEMAIDSDEEDFVHPSIDDHMLPRSRALSDSNNFTIHHHHHHHHHALFPSPIDFDNNGLSVPRSFKGRTLSAESLSPRLSKLLGNVGNSSNTGIKDPTERVPRGEHKTKQKQRQSWLRRLTSPSRTQP
ncbi:AIG_G0050290.mRNA.1.CDS.1 [Saccharomyces cerevisiae]|nr:AIG_G0050290.mRNA.1.CDS.1 [Saccharomyces cerevisiae]CAI6885645.1 AIG_G0050290.mRNA.1.CDS.1 [Saccharomyces cerevisiae]